MKFRLCRVSAAGFTCNKRFGKCFAFLLFIVQFLIFCAATAQTDSLKISDTATLASVTVTAFGNNAKWKDVPAAIAVISQQHLQRFDNKTLVPVLNTVAGVRMEERSPASYRLSIRGSLLRSPFGVRNIKIYWNDIPLTDAGGNTYLNLVDINQLTSIEIIKGPASSMYGANTGGAVLLKSDPTVTARKNVFIAGLEAGSFGLFNEQAGFDHHEKNISFALQQSHIQSDGYRQQSESRRDALEGNFKWHINKKEQLSALMFYANLHYETPGGITQHQMDSLPTLARQPAGSLPGAVQQQAGVFNKTFFSGTSLTSELNNAWRNTTTVTVNHTDFKNPFITNFEHRNEFNYGARTVFELSGLKFKWFTGAEWQQNMSHINNSANNGGVPGVLFFEDKIRVIQYFLFTEVNLRFEQFIVEAGLSVNQQQLKYNRVSDSVYNFWQHQNTNVLPTPRISALYNVSHFVSVYGIFSRGFSPPTLAEIRPSTNQFYDLQPEYGWNIELGLKGTTLNSRLEFDASVYSFNLKNAIVRQTDSSGADFFVNAGGTKQRGTEFWFSAHIVRSKNGFITKVTLSNSFTYQPYKFNNYVSGTKSFSGNWLTGVPKYINVTMLDISTAAGIYLNTNFNFTSSIPLTDANDVYASDYKLLQAKVGYQQQFLKITLNLYFGVDNLLDENYSLGNDLNAAGGRYFNPAPKRNFFGGVSLSF